tara:strand:- start:36 stop:473 length:438 start_codon:yes stop_codon:yes gene_type:complete
MSRVVSLDPGRNKCGLILVDCNRHSVIEGHVLATEAVPGTLLRWRTVAAIERLVMGNGTASDSLKRQLPADLPVKVVDERGSTLRARKRYWQLWPPRGWRRFIPQGLLLPPTELDAVAALVILESELGQQLVWPGPAPIRTGRAQ